MVPGQAIPGEHHRGIVFQRGGGDGLNQPRVVLTAEPKLSRLRNLNLCSREETGGGTSVDDSSVLHESLPGKRESRNVPSTSFTGPGFGTSLAE